MSRVSQVREEAQTLALGLGRFCCFFSFFFFLPSRLVLPTVVQCQQVQPVCSCCFWLGHLSGLVTAEVWGAAFGEQQFLGACEHCLFHLCHGCVHPKVCIPVLSLIPQPGSALGSPAAGPASVTADTRTFGLSFKALLDMFGHSRTTYFGKKFNRIF